MTHTIGALLPAAFRLPRLCRPLPARDAAPRLRLFGAGRAVPGLRLLRAVPAAALAALTALCAPPARSGPYGTTPDGSDPRLMLKGNDPVMYFTAGRAIPGQPGIKADFDGVTYRFVNDWNKLEFQKNPFKYIPQFGGFCANAMSYGLPYAGDPESFKIIDGRLYVFLDERQRRYFLMDEDGNLRRAHGYWKNEVEGGIALVQRYRRLAVRVPHYRTDKELEAEWRSRNAPSANAAPGAAAPATPATLPTK